MSLRGRAFLSMWFSIPEEITAEFDRWHTIEHMPERLGIPGFQRGRRYVHGQTGRTGFQLYEGTHIETFRSPGYLARLNAPTPWSQRIQPSMVDFVRGACRVLISVGEGVGGSLLTVRLIADNAEQSQTEHAIATAALGLSKLHGVTAVHIGHHVPEITSTETAETRLRSTTKAPEFDFVLLIEGVNDSALEDATPKLGELVGVSARSLASDVYRLAYLLDHDN